MKNLLLYFSSLNELQISEIFGKSKLSGFNVFKDLKLS